ncbi:MAG: hypothetical protein AAFR61_24895 [Bacteroidota bacterium]
MKTAVENHANEDKQPQTGRTDGPMTEAAINYHLTEWFGAIFFYLLNAGRKSFHHCYSKSHRGRNLVVGYLLGLLFFIGVIALVSQLLF